MSTLTFTKSAHPADGSGRWNAAGPRGNVQYDLLGNHITMLPTGGELDSAMGPWPSRCADAAAIGDDAVFEVLAELYRREVAA